MDSSRNSSRSLQIETLESREMMAVSATLTAGGILNIIGSKKADAVYFNQSNGYIAVSGVSQVWSTSQINSIVVDMGKGKDVVSFNSLGNGGNEALSESVTVRPISGKDLFRCAGNHDYQLGKKNSISLAANGTVTVNGQVQSWSVPTPPNPPTPPTPPNPTNWFDSNVIDAALRSLGSSLYTDGRIDRNDMINLLRNAEDGGIIDATELTDLRAITSNSTLFGSFDYVWKLSSYVVYANTANAKYQGQSLGNLAAGSNTAHMENLINKWFLGLDRPTAGGTYRQFAGQLFVGGAAYTDVRQGALGDCYLMASLAETALRNQAAITNMFVVNGDGTYTVRFYNYGTPHYVTVDSYLPTNGAGNLMYANHGTNYANSAAELWTALAEKAYVQINEMGWLRGGLPGNGQNAYSAIEGGYLYAGLGQITGQATTPFAYTSGTTNFTTFVNAWNQGKSIGFASKTTPATSAVVGSHAYVVVGYNASNQTITLYNPWGIEYGLVTMTWSQIQDHFSYFDRTV